MSHSTLSTRLWVSLRGFCNKDLERSDPVAPQIVQSISIEYQRTLLEEFTHTSPLILSLSQISSRLSLSSFSKKPLNIFAKDRAPSLFHHLSQNASTFVAMNFQLVLVSIALATFALAAPSLSTEGQVFQAPVVIPSIWRSIGKASSSRKELKAESSLGRVCAH